MKIFGVVVSQRDPFNHWSRSEWIRYGFEITVKSAYTIFKPTVVSILFGIIWHHYIYERHLYFDGDQEILLTGFLVVAGLAWGLFATKAYDVAIDQFYEARRIVRQLDFEKLIERYDEKLPPLMHVQIFFLALLVIIPIIFSKYGKEATGYFCVIGGSFVLLLAFFVLREIDKPFSGTWTLNNVPDDWREKNMAAVRAEYIRLRIARTQSLETPAGKTV